MAAFRSAEMLVLNRSRELRAPGAVRFFRLLVVTAAAASALSGCKRLEPLVGLLPPKIAPGVRGILGLEPTAAESASPSPSPSPTPSEVVLDAAARARLNSEILQEMYRVALQREPESRVQFGTLVDTLNQGASFEGIYNGLIHSAEWAALEHSGRAASPAVLRAFAEEMAHLELSLPHSKRRLFLPADARPLSVSVDFGALERDAARALDFPGTAPGPEQDGPGLPPENETWDEAVRRIELVFVGANHHVLKRQLGDEVMRVIDLKGTGRMELVVWFGEFAARTSARGIDFGLQKRNDPSPDVHRNWAWSVSVDRIQWEALNRVHRILNAAAEN